MRRFSVLLVGAFLLTLTVVAGARVVGEMHAVAVGVACGLAASVPGSLAAVFLMSGPSPAPAERPGSAPAPVVIMAGGATLQRPPLPVYLPPAEQVVAGNERRYRIVGEEG